MYILKPIYHDTVWGGKRLLDLCDEYKGNRIAHLYSLYCRQGISNMVLNGYYKGMSFNQVFDELKNEWGMEEYVYFPLTLALVDAMKDLSIQVHPNHEIAYQLENEPYGKRESWYFIEAPSLGWIYNGCNIKNMDELEDAFDKNEIGPKCFDKLEVKKGDYVYCSPGTIHALTAGSLVYEIEEGSDYTYRIYDYNRKDSEGNTRELHLDKAMKALNPENRSQVRHYKENEGIFEVTYETRKYENIDEYINTSSEVECFTIIKGECICDSIFCHGGMTIVLLPGESISGPKLKLCIVAKLRRNVK